MEEVVIGSAHARITLSELSLTDGEGWRAFRVTFEDSGLRATQIVQDHVGLVMSDARTGTSGLAELVRSTVAEYRGWEGIKRWESLECQFEVNATTDRTGHATFTAMLYKGGGGWGWQVRMSVTLDVMERERLARELDSFFAHRAV